MSFPRFGPFIFVAQWFLAVLLPVWVAVGREALGVELGWAVLAGLVYGPIVIVALLVPPFASLFDREVRRRKSERAGYSVALGVAWVALFLSAFVLSDSGDSRSLPSALTLWTNGAIGEDITEPTFFALLVITGFAILAALSLAIAGAVRAARPQE